MTLLSPSCRSARPPYRSGEQGFTITEFVIATAIVVLVAGALAVFVQSTGVTLLNITNQSTYNQEAGHAAEFIISRIRLANSASNDASGEILTLSFDDNPDVDSSGDKTAWNDKDHYEEFRFEKTDGSSATLSDNKLTYKANTAGTATTLVRSGVRKLPSLSVFSITNTSTVQVNFGLLATNATVHSQAIEIRTQGRLRNKTE
jgi:Tfp pilus assembly protein PilW